MELSRQQEIIARSDHYLMKTYLRYPVAFVRGQGCYLWDADGKKYLDMLSGVAVNALGHAHPDLLQALSAQLAKLIHTSNLFYSEAQAELAKQLCDRSFAEQVFFCNSGAEANEAAVKLARLYQKKHRGPECTDIITMEGSFHGRTLGMIAATGQNKIKRGFEPIPAGFVHVPYDDLESLRQAMSPRICAVMLEPIQGEGGVRVPAADYLQGVRELCRQHGALLICDEVQTGMGRTGTLFAYEQAGAAPDILTLAKGLGAGLPIGACLATAEVARAFEPGSHASTFGGNFLACEAARAFLHVLERDRLLDRVKTTGVYLFQKLRGLQQKFAHLIREVRGRGLMIGVELTCNARPLVEAALQKGLILNSVQEKTLRLVPPLIVSPQEIDEAFENFESVLAAADQTVS